MHYILLLIFILLLILFLIIIFLLILLLFQASSARESMTNTSSSVASPGWISTPVRPRSFGDNSASTRALIAWPKIVAWRTPGRLRRRSSRPAESGEMISKRRVPGG